MGISVILHLLYVTSKLVWFSLVTFETSENESSLLYSVVTYNTVLLFLIFMFVFK